MDFSGLLDRVVALLEQRGRLSYRALGRVFELDDARLDDVKFELIEVRGVRLEALPHRRADISKFHPCGDVSVKQRSRPC
jgi:hypothetical protein